jgi:paraquat-inducible protein B
VGQVSAYDLDKDGRGVTFTIFIKSPYDRLVKTSSLFWQASGINLTLNANGLKVNTESLISILLGGISFEVPQAKNNAPRAKSNSTFTLFADQEEAMNHAETAQPFRLVFRNCSVRGLDVGSPVELDGVSLGEVTKINLEFDPGIKDFYIVVNILFYPERIHGSGAARTSLNALVSRGLRAQLGNGNLLTGQRYIALGFIPKAPEAKINWGGQPPVFPTFISDQGDLQESLTRIARKIDKMPLNEIAAEVRQAVRNLDQSLQSADKLIKTVNTDIVPGAHIMLKDAHGMLTEAKEVLSKESPLRSDLHETLRELSRAARSVKNLTDYLERNPESLIRGKKGDDQ